MVRVLVLGVAKLLGEAEITAPDFCLAQRSVLGMAKGERQKQPFKTVYDLQVNGELI